MIKIETTSPKSLFSDEVLVVVLTSLGINCGSFTYPKSNATELLKAANKITDYIFRIVPLKEIKQ